MKVKTILLIWLLLVLGQAVPLQSQVVTSDEAAMLAKNWIQIIQDRYGKWGDHETAMPGAIEVLKDEGKPIGYYCLVEPEGFIVMSLRKELAPVKMYTEYGTIDMKAEAGLPDLIRGSLKRIIDKIETQVSSIQTASPLELKPLLELDYSGAWQSAFGYSAGKWLKIMKDEGMDNYMEGDVLLTSDWHQTEPYNDQCPDMGCTWTCNSNTNALVGCVATAGAQIARYWSWPPYGTTGSYSDPYDWANMPDDMQGCTWVQAEVDAVAELCHEVGTAVGMDYGCGASGAYTFSMEGVFEYHYRYSSDCDVVYHNSIIPIDWFERIKTQINLNRPIQYRIPGHSIVCDGWQEIGDPVIRQYHMNYGWSGPGDDIWYTLDALQGGDPSAEYMVEYIYPVQSLGTSVSGDYYPPTFPYRYVDQDIITGLATFHEGQFIQFLPNRKITGILLLNYVKFIGTPSDNTILFSHGDVNRGVRIQGGVLRMHNSGSIKMY